MTNLLGALKENPFVLAPMAAITDSPFRTFMKELGAGVVITELVSSYGLIYKSTRTLELTKFDEIQRPVGVQIFGEESNVMADAAKIVEDLGADFVDINLGCPVQKVTKKGGGAALLRDPENLERVLSTIKRAISIPLTIKIRTGWDEQSINAKEVVRAAYNSGVTWVAIHGRTKAQGYAGKANWDLIAEVKRDSPLPIIGNGDITSSITAVSRLRESGCDGVMIGRGCLKNPWIFKQATEKLKDVSETTARKDFAQTLIRLKELVEENRDSRRATLQMKKFVSWFSAGYPNSQSFRKSLFGLYTAGEILDLSNEYFSTFSLNDQLDTSSEAFLMGGHG